ncbi:Putative signal transduction response regulator, receiver domain, histidine kinase/HSP90-like ATPase [Septoria linicola]|uniref:histidine kinase n=1 Tax=Septoria linicola TaxID=215465 RepID=A0A9Q9B3G5_9PEZI|nr:Putative signal transduction response regulator, receiver domain, histidine kinase/HSP90-like ATPase [Septoria linicola]
MSSGGEPVMERQTICFPNHGTQSVLQHGDAGFKEETGRWYSNAESNALERLIALKRELRQLPQDDFWAAVTEGMSQLLGADICFVMKRVLVDEQEVPVEMPPIGEPGSCIMAAALHYHANDGSKNTVKSTKFHAYGCPCAYMRHDKVFVIPERLGDFITNNPNELPTPCEAYMALPLFDEGKCFGHFGAMWSVERAAQRQLSWASIEMLMHSLEDMISARFLEGANFIAQAKPVIPEKSRVIPHDAVTVAQSLRPYAGSLSHELRTPMQGIVGMLDVMYTTVEECVDSSGDLAMKEVFEQLKQNIETVQDSSRRAVEAADNVVHAYDMDMALPDAPAHLLEEPSEPFSPYSATADKRPDILVAGSNLPFHRSNKRRRDDAFGSGSRATSNASTHANKIPKLTRTPSSCARCAGDSQEVKDGLQEAEDVQKLCEVGALPMDAPTMNDAVLASGSAPSSSRIIAPGLRHTGLRELIQYVINEGLKVGGRPDSTSSQDTDTGELIEVRNRGSDGTFGQTMIEWSIDPAVPTTMFIDEKDLSKLISCVFLNALKFTDKRDGRIRVAAKMSKTHRFISIRISDNGPGIPAAFLPHLFKPFSQQNGSITRSSDGLGLGLLVAKGIARKLGGDLNCTKAQTEGPDHGSEFELKIPLHAGETISRPGSPFSSPLPRQAELANGEPPHIRPPPAAPSSPRRLSRALHDVVGGGSKFYSQKGSHLKLPDTPPSPRSKIVNMTLPDAAITPESDSSSPATSPTTTSTPAIDQPQPRQRVRKSIAQPAIDRDLAKKYPLTFLVAEDNKINRKLLVSMLGKFGYRNIYEAHDGTEAVRQMDNLMHKPQPSKPHVDVVLMDLWMPLMDGYEATERILNLPGMREQDKPTVLAVTADVTDGALERAAEVGMKGFMTKPYKMLDLQRLILEYCATQKSGDVSDAAPSLGAP